MASNKSISTKIPVKATQWTGQEDTLEELRKKHRNLKHHYQLLLEEKSRIKGERDFCRTDYDKYRSLYENVRKENRHLQDKNTQLIKDVEQCRLQLHQGSRGDDARLDQLSQQLRRVTRERDELEKSLQSYFEDMEHAKEDRDKLKYKFSEVQREKDRMTEKLRNVNSDLDFARKEISKLSQQNDLLQQQLTASDHSPQDNHQGHPHLPNGVVDHSKQVEELLERIKGLQEQNQLLERAVKAKDHPSGHQKHLGIATVGSGGLIKKNGREKGGSSPNLNSLSGLHDNSAKQIHQMASRVSQKLSLSANSLESDNPAHLSQLCSQLKEQLAEADRLSRDTHKENLHLTNQMQAMTNKMDEMNCEIDSLQNQLDGKAKELSDCSEQMRILSREKTVAMREHSSVYEELQQLKSEISELKAEKEVVTNERDINSQQQEKMMSRQFELKKKLDAIISQRSQDAKELSNMKTNLDRALEELQSTRTTMEEIASNRDRAEQELHQVRSALSRSRLRHGIRRDSPSTPQTTSEEVSMMVEDLAHSEMMKNALLERLFQDKPSIDIEAITMQEAEGKTEELFNKIHDLKVELRHKSSSTAFHDPQDVSGDADLLRQEVTTLTKRLTIAKSEKDKLLDEVRELDKEIRSLRVKHDKTIEEHAKTLERVDEIWKQKWKINWDEAWEEKRVSFQLDLDGKAGFAIMGGRDQSQLPNPNAIIVTQVNPLSPAEGLLKVGDVIETVNGINLSNVEHREAKRAVKECNGTVTMLIRRRTCPQSGMESVLHAVGKSPKPQHQVSIETQLENHEFSIMVGRDGLGFKWNWESVFKVSEVSHVNLCNEILRVGDRIMKVNGTSVTQDKPSAIKKLLKPNKQGVLSLMVERATMTPTALSPTSEYPPLSRLRSQSFSPTGPVESSPNSTMRSPPTSTVSQEATESQLDTQNDIDERREYSSMFGGGYRQQRAKYTSLPQQFRQQPAQMERYYRPRGGYNSAGSSSGGEGPTKLVSLVVPPHQHEGGAHNRGYSERRIEFAEFVETEPTQGESQPYSGSEYSQGEYEFTSSSPNLSFNDIPTAFTNKSLTVATLPTQEPPLEDEGSNYFDRIQETRNTTKRRRDSSLSNIDGEATSYTGTQDSLSGGYGLALNKYGRSGGSRPRIARPLRNFGRWDGDQESNTSLNSQEHAVDQSPEQRGRAHSDVAINKLGHHGNMPPSRSMDSMYSEQYYDDDPLADAVYIRANFSYLPCKQKELKVDCGNVFHILDDSPMVKGSFRVSRLHDDGTDAEHGTIPNSYRAFQYVQNQGLEMSGDMYEEVEPFHGVRPVIIFGALADLISSQLIEDFPTEFYPAPLDVVEGQISEGEMIESQLEADVASNKALYYQVDKSRKFSVLYKEKFTQNLRKKKHCVLPSSYALVQSLSTLAPPITILVKAKAPESISTFHPDKVPMHDAERIFAQVSKMTREYESKCSTAIFLITLDVLVSQIKNIVKSQQMKQAWIPVVKEPGHVH